MKTIRIGVFLIITLSLNLAAQVNLVPNPSFEDSVHCPTMYGQIYYATHWSGLGTADYFNSCASGTQVTVPSNVEGYQMARTGNAYAGFYTWGAGANVREYIQAKLDSTLTANHKYCTEFYVSMGDIGMYACNNIGVYFSDTMIVSTTNLFSLSPQISNNILANPLIDKINWTKVSGSFIATGGENYITIGNFLNDANSDTVLLSTGGIYAPYYYIDDVSVVDCTGIGVNDITQDESIEVYPNPSTESITLTTNSQQLKTIRIYNVLGSEMLRQVQHDKNATIDIGGFPEGVYFVEVVTEKGVMRKKFVKE